MRELLHATLLSGALLLLPSLAAPQQPEVYRPPLLAAATNTEYPIQSVAHGVVVLSVLVNADGEVDTVRPLRDIPSLTMVAESDVRSWRFEPAEYGGINVAAEAIAAFVFRPPLSLWAPPSFTPTLPAGSLAVTGNTGEKVSRIKSPGILSVEYADYPVNSVAFGSVVLQVTVGENGKPSQIEIVRDMPPFTQLAVKAAKRWRFQPAELDGEPVKANVGIAFVFAPPRLNPRAARERLDRAPVSPQR